jgi:hypothetical protein
MDWVHDECLSHSAIGARLEARGRQPAVEQLEVRLVHSGGLRGLTYDQAHRNVTVTYEVGHPIAGAAAHEAPGLQARLAGPIDSSGKAVVIGRASPGTKVRLDLEADGTIERHARANARGHFRLVFHVGYGTTPIQLMDLRAGFRPRVAELAVYRLDTQPPTLKILSPSTGVVTSTDVTIIGEVADDQSGVGMLTARLDGGPLIPVPVAPGGQFTYTPRLPLDGTENGQHVVQFQVTDRTGNLSATAGLTYTLEAPVDAADSVVLRIADQPSQPVLTLGDPGTEGNQHGFEGGTVVELNGFYYLFTSEMIGDPLGVKMRLALWKSPDGLAWTRVSTLYESSGTTDGTDPRAALWSPLPIFDEAANRWNLFYVAYRSLPSTPQAYRVNYDGEIWRAVSTQPGLNGIEGPYQDVGVVLQPGPDSQPWEGIQGTDSFYPFQVGNRWYAFYGSADPSEPNPYWEVGLATAPDLAGPWVRLADGNPVPLDPQNGVENPIVTRLASGLYIAVFDALGYSDRIGYTVSSDGIHWSPARYLKLNPGSEWTDVVRTPLGLIPEPDGTYTLFYTGYYQKPGYGTYSGLGVLKLNITTGTA